MQKISSVFVLSSLYLFSGCVTKSGTTEYLCEGLCTYKTAKGSIQRIALSSHGQDQQLTWQGLQRLCLEVQGIGAFQNDKQISEPLTVSEITVVGESKEYGFRLATLERDCEKRIVAPANR